VFAYNLRQIRKRAGMKIYVAARCLGVAKSTWSQWESGKHFPTVTMLAAIAVCLNVPPCVLLKKAGRVCQEETDVQET
jgi:transcriptional regulator with XRE-family HTH domain